MAFYLVAITAAVAGFRPLGFVLGALRARTWRCLVRDAVAAGFPQLESRELIPVLKFRILFRAAS